MLLILGMITVVNDMDIATPSGYERTFNTTTLGLLSCD